MSHLVSDVVKFPRLLFYGILLKSMLIAIFSATIMQTHV